MSPEEFSLMAAKPDGWPYLLLARAFRREINSATLQRRRWHEGLVNEARSALAPEAYRELIERQVSEARRAYASLKALWTIRLREAFTPPCDATLILECARTAGDEYRALLAWKPAVLAASVPAGLAGLRDDFSRMCDPMVLQMETIAHGYGERVLAALFERVHGQIPLELPPLDTAPADRLLARRELGPQ